MSYILGALRKAEHERKGEDGQKVDDWDSKEWNAVETSSGIGFGLKIAAILVIALLVAIFILLWILIGNLSDSTTRAIEVELVNNADQLEFAEPIVPPTAVTTQETDLPVVSAAESAAIESGLIESQADAEPRIPEITGHLHFPSNESLSRIFADASSYRVGHIFEDGLELVSISESQAVFEWRDKRYEIPLRSY